MPHHDLMPLTGINMNLNTRKLLGVPLILLIVIFWATGASIIYEKLLVDMHTVILLIYFAIAGFGWFYPATVAIRWMSARPHELDPEEH